MTGEEIRMKRTELGLTQGQLAQKLGLNQQFLSRIERGVSSLDGSALAKVLRHFDREQEAIGVQPDTPDCMRRFVLPGGPGRVQIDPGLSWYELRSHLCNLEKPGHTPSIGFQKATRADSRIEVTGLHQLCVAGARPCYLSPTLCGFLRHPLIDAAGWALGARAKAALFLAQTGWNVLIFPQITMRLMHGSVRPDALLRVENGNRVIWCAYEIDGTQHKYNLEYDQSRDERLEIDVLRFPSQQIRAANFASLLRTALVSRYHLPELT